MLQSNPKPTSASTPRAVESVRAQMAPAEQPEGAVADDLIGSGATRALGQEPRGRAGARKILLLHVRTGAGSAICGADRIEPISGGSG
jgi:hypothetical protein